MRNDVRMANVNRDVGGRVARVRSGVGMTQAELADEMSVRLGREVRPLTVTRLEGGKRPIGVDELIAAAESMGVPLSDLVPGDVFGRVDFAAARAAVEMSRARRALMDALREWVRVCGSSAEASRELVAVAGEAGLRLSASRRTRSFR